MKKYTIKGKLAMLNEHDAANRGNKFGGANLKKRMTEFVYLQMLNKPRITRPSMITFHWFYASRHDFDNVRFAAKYILDGMVKAKILPNDNQKWVLGFGGDYFVKVPVGLEKVIVEIEEY